MLDFDAARQQLLNAARADFGLDIERVSLSRAAGRVAAAAITAGVNVPPQDNSAMDGIAFAFSDLPVTGDCQLPVSAKYFAGMAPASLQPGTAVRLFTGAVIPVGADTVALQEDCSFVEGDDGALLSVVINEAPTLGQHVRKAGEDICKGTEVLAKGSLLDARHLGLLASCGIAEVDVYKVLRIGLLATGDELVAPGKVLQPGQIYNSNLPMLAAELAGMGFQVDARHVADDLSAIKAVLISMADSCDVIVTIGGVSVGDADLVKAAIESLGRLELWKVAMKPGKPLSFGYVVGDAGIKTALIGLPGNPVSAFAAFQLFAKPYLKGRMGCIIEDVTPMRFPLMVSRPLRPKREEFMRVQLQCDDGEWIVKPYPHQGSGVLSSVVWATGFARLPGNSSINCGDAVAYLPFE